METKNARIRSTFLGKEDHGIPTAIVSLDYGVSVQGFGTHDLRYEKYGIPYLMSILETLEVDSWEKLPGTFCRAKADGGKVYAIGHIIKDQWFCPEEADPS